MSIANMFNRKFYLIIAFIFLAELLSLFGFLVPQFGQIAFFIIVILTLILSLIKLEYGLCLVLVELFIGSKGYLFFFEHNGFIISIRIALWLIVMSIWLAKVITESLRKKKIQIELFQSRYIYYFIILFCFIFWGLVNGIINNNTINNIFFDFNNWLYLTLIFPVYSIFNKPTQELQDLLFRLLQIFTASVLWLSIKTMLLLYIFSHNFIGIVNELYRWIRVTGVGEITLIQGGFYRVFFQSHIFILISFLIGFFLLVSLINHRNNNKKIIFIFFLTALFLAINILNFSRSNWLGLTVGLIISLLIIIKKLNWKKAVQASALLIVCIVTSLLLIIGIVKFPIPIPIGGFQTSDLLSQRATMIKGEAALSSRWELYPHLKNKIFQAPVIGHGFGTTVTYKSSDPRILEQSPTGEYTTYAFEWGWLDIWIKLGIFGILIYIALIFKIFITAINRYSLNNNNAIYYGLITGLIAIASVSFFSPYMNHPLGLGYLILITALFDSVEKNKLPI